MNYKNKNFYRVVDANVNRAKEGLRVLEDILRFVCDDKKLTGEVKKIRHQLTDYLKLLPDFKAINLLKFRNAVSDVGKKTINLELQRNNVSDIFLANAQRVKESIRVLEEFMKISHKHSALLFKKLRYKIYSLEKRAIEKISKICHNNYEV
ncbi:MAG: thiamine-phosphate pyrophosphorylase [Candidatus Omnitrophica bacterium]|nr:thiamine-phosphate pyrophosphorylase [Candidatus Omnitrophota bacterium]